MSMGSQDVSQHYFEHRLETLSEVPWPVVIPVLKKTKKTNTEAELVANSKGKYFKPTYSK